MQKGPNAPTQDSLNQQLMSNNATWAVIDRGEPDSYLAIWDFIEYMGQGGMLERQCKLLKNTWEEMALENNSLQNPNLTLTIVMRDFEIKKKLREFVQALIFCIVPTREGPFRYNSVLANQFQKVVEAAVESHYTPETKNSSAISTEIGGGGSVGLFGLGGR